jgi:hypothetical protein
MYTPNTSKCPKCQMSNFEMNTETVLGSVYKINIIRCSSCRTAIGTTDYFNAGDLIHKLAKSLGKNLD